MSYLRARKIKFFLTTWTGRILLLNTLVFLGLLLLSRDLLTAPQELLIAFGAKDPVTLAHGQWWRLITPLFVHIGIIHFVLNNLALRFIGQQIEDILGGGWFLLIYITSGLVGNIASSYVHLALGAGASGAIFGLIGVGVTIEYCIFRHEKKPATLEKTISLSQLKTKTLHFLQLGPFTSLAVINIAFSVFVNLILSIFEDIKIGVDNAAHLGGLFSGILLTFSMLNLRKNRFISVRKVLGFGILAAVAITSTATIYDLTKTDTIFNQYKAEIANSTDDYRSYYLLSQAILIDPTESYMRFQRGSLLMFHNETRAAMNDLLLASENLMLIDEFETLSQKLLAEDKKRESSIIQNILTSMHQKSRQIY